MNKVSRRALSSWAADQLIAGKSAKNVAEHLAAELTESSRSGELDFLIADIGWELEQRQALAVGRVISATPLSEQLQKALAEQIKQATKAESVLLNTEVDKSVIGGVRIETARHVWDQTVSHKLAELREV